MKSEPLMDALGEIRSDMLQAAETAGRDVSGRRHKRIRLLLLTAALIALLTGMAHAEIDSGAVSNLLAPLYGGVQTELAGSIGIPTDASTTVDGYTLTADAVIGDRYNIAIVYTLRRDDGQPIPEGAYFDGHSNSVRQGSGGGSVRHEPCEDAASLRIIEEWSGARPFLLRRNAKVVFQDLAVHDAESGDTTILVPGTWELNFTIRYRDTTVEVPVGSLEVTGSEGLVYRVHEIMLSPLSVHLELTAPNTLSRDNPLSRLMPDFSLSAQLTDGSVVQLVGANSGGGGNVDSQTLDAHYGAMFPFPTPVEDIEALIICDTTFPLK